LALSDCTMDINQELHESALMRIELFFGWVCNSEDLVRALGTFKGPPATVPAPQQPTDN
jgi:hypothetical protein